MASAEKLAASCSVCGKKRRTGQQPAPRARAQRRRQRHQRQVDKQIAQPPGQQHAVKAEPRRARERDARGLAKVERGVDARADR